MLSVVIRIYRIEKENRKTIGTAQAVNSDETFSFSDIDEIWLFYSRNLIVKNRELTLCLLLPDII